MNELKITIINPDNGFENKVTIDPKLVTFSLGDELKVLVYFKGLKYGQAFIKESIMDIAVQLTDIVVES